MFRGLGSWLGLDPESEPQSMEEKSQPIQDTGEESASTEKTEGTELEGTAPEEAEDVLLRQAKGFGSYLLSMASVATKKISESVTETAHTIKKSVEEGKIDGIIDKTIIGEFQKEQDKFVQEKSNKKAEAAVPPWVGYSEEETIQQQILALSADRRNFLRDPPAGVHFNFDFDQMYPVALVMLQEDELLNRMRFDLVPKLVKEDVFWRNYFYRVSLIKQSAQLTALAAQQSTGNSDKTNGKQSHEGLEETVRPKTPPVAIKSPHKSQEEEEEISTSPGMSEFVSEAFDSCNIDQEDLRKEMEQFVLDKKDEVDTAEEESEDWIKELQQVVQEYEVVSGTDKLKDENWDKEIEELLQEN
ncbi:synapse-associated protein 1 [Phyllobates terribilis]|uniref:synapse-associated protein 1 n=1 Tax=Phyllobates terribilis TaxID=111132 RepID=UPI003CCB6035